MSKHKTIEELLESFLKSYFSERNVENTLDCVTDNICWIGTSDYEKATGKAELKQMLEEDVGEQDNSYDVQITDMITNPLSESCVNINIFGKQETSEFSMTMRATICCVNDGEGWLISNVHASVSNQLQREGEFYPHHNDDFNYEQLRREIFDMLFTDKDVENGINAVIERVGKVFNVSRVYIFENSMDNLSASNTFEWCAKGIKPEKDNLQSIRYVEDMGGEYMDNFDENGLFYCPDISKLPQVQRAVLEPQGIKSMLQIEIKEDNIFRGFIGFDVCGEVSSHQLIDRKKVKILAYLSKLISVSLMRERHYQNISSYQKQLEESLKAEENLRIVANNANNAKSDFFARMSHDMRTPLNCILGTVQLAINDNPDNKYYEEFNNIFTSGAFLLSLINDVLDMSKIEKGEIDLHPEKYPYKEFINDITNMIEPICNEKNITLNMNPLDSATAILVDKIRFRQIFFNVFSNAVKYTPNGGTVDHYTEIEVIDENHIDCKCHVIDNGIGMSEDFQKHLFEPYLQEKQDGYAAVQGSGLGLSIANSLAHAMGGEIIIKSELGKGTEVIIHTKLEVVDTDSFDNETYSKSFDEIDINGRKILLCEDHPLNAKIAIRILEKAGCIVEWAENGKIGIDIFKQKGGGYFDAVVMDILMPVMNGLDAARAIRNSDSDYAKNIPIIAMTANAFDEDRQRSKQAGMNAHIAKPIDMGVLYNTIYELIK